MACMRVSQLSFLLITFTRAPTAAMSGSTNPRIRWPMASCSITQSESTDTMISDVASRTARLMDRRLPMFTALRSTVTRDDSSAARCACCQLSSVD